ncbi:MAG TPA: sugar ABC transporter substrate-binding protein [Bacillales bacterium]|nr:sugar ABC transporter substrate-binding protein [Bacillales bacterium]
MKKIMGCKKWLMIGMVLVLSIVTFGCSGQGNSEGSAGDGNGQKDLKGTEIKALLPPWSKIPQSMLDEFKKESGITVHIETLGWDDIHDKIVTSAAAGVAPADITEFDWSWVGQFGASNWYEPLNQYFDQKLIDDIPTMDIFKYNDHYLAMPYFNDFRVTYINEKYFKAAGITEMPQTPQQLIEDAKKIKSKGIVDYPLGLPLSATEGAATPWYLMTKAYGGELFDKDWNPLFTSKNSAGYKAMQFIIESMKEDHIIDPAAVSLKDVDVIDQFKSGKSAIDLSGWSGNYAVYKDSEKSKVSDSVQMIPVPGKDGESRTFGLVGAFGIPKASKHKEASVAFIKWLNQPENVKKLYKDLGLLPNRKSVLESMNEAGELPGGDTILKVLPTVEPLFPQGTPPWYPEFSTTVATTINQMAKGSLSLDEGIQKIGDKAKEITQK